MLRAIALFASSRRNGNTGQLMDRIAKELDIEVVDLGNARMSAYDYEHRNRDDDFEPLMKRVLDFDHIIFASPVYWYSVSPPMKVFLDRISDFLDLPDLLDHGRRLRGKQAYIVYTSVDDEVSKAFLDIHLSTSACVSEESFTSTVVTAIFLTGTTRTRWRSLSGYGMRTRL